MGKKYWLGAIGGLAAIDVYAAHVKHGGTLSETGRWLFRTDTKPGKVVWVASWAALSAWLLPHIWTIPQNLKDVSS